MENPFQSLAEKFLIWLDNSIKEFNLKKKQNFIFVGLFLVSLVYYFFISPPSNFPTKNIINIKEGSGLYSLSISLEKEGIVRSAISFRTLAIILGGEKDMKAGDYYLRTPQSSLTLAWRILNGERDIEKARITIPEGFTKQEISKLFSNKFSKFDHETFIQKANEGYLFPDTYFIEISATATSTVDLLNNNFNRRIAPLQSDINKSKHTLNEIIIMASILEAEAKLPEEMSMASGILWKRISIGMPLQVDSDMSTYKVPGLPKEPINNPGLNAISAALYPKSSQYLYFLTDKLGVMHYARTFDEHKANKAKYLR
ncbi:MAG: endolytic transglycosylase MltG [Minisyncoccia bacterium]